MSEITFDYKDLQLEAVKAPLTKAHESLLIETIKVSPEIVFEWNPKHIPALIEYNYNIALEALSIMAVHPKGMK
jgi:hypothetical protein